MTTASSWSSTRELTPELRAEGDARELQRAIQDLRKEAGLELDDEIDLPSGARPRGGRLPADPWPPTRWRGWRTSLMVMPSRARPSSWPRAPARLRSGAGPRRSLSGVSEVAAVTPAVAGRPLWLQFVGLAASIVVIDQVTKAWITDALAPNGVIRLVGDNLRLVYTENNGALFGLFHGQALPFAILSSR